MALAFFDVDGTLTRFDTFIPYCLLSLLYRPQRLFGPKPLLKAFFDFWKGRIQREKLKEAFLVTFLEGARREDIDRWNRIFLRLFNPRIVIKAKRGQAAFWLKYHGDGLRTLTEFFNLLGKRGNEVFSFDMDIGYYIFCSCKERLRKAIRMKRTFLRREVKVERGIGICEADV